MIGNLSINNNAVNTLNIFLQNTVDEIECGLMALFNIL